MSYSKQSLQQQLLAFQKIRQQLSFLASQGFSGLHGSLTIKPHREFEQYMPYQVGDSVALVDWRRYCKSGDLLVRYGSSDSIGKVVFTLDESPSMLESSDQLDGWTKDHCQRLLVAILSLLTSKQDDQWALAYWQARSYLVPFGSGKGHFDQTLERLDEPLSSNSTGDAFDGQLKSDLGLFFTDGYHSSAHWQRQLSFWRELEPTASLLMIILETEAELKASFGHHLFVDPEAPDHPPIPFRGSKLKQSYLNNRRDHFDAVDKICKKFSVNYLRFSIDDPLDQILNKLFRYLREICR